MRWLHSSGQYPRQHGCGEVGGTELVCTRLRCCRSSQAAPRSGLPPDCVMCRHRGACGPWCLRPGTSTIHNILLYDVFQITTSWGQNEIRTSLYRRLQFASSKPPAVLNHLILFNLGQARCEVSSIFIRSLVTICSDLLEVIWNRRAWTALSWRTRSVVWMIEWTQTYSLAVCTGGVEFPRSASHHGNRTVGWTHFQQGRS